MSRRSERSPEQKARYAAKARERRAAMPEIYRERDRKRKERQNLVSRIRYARDKTGKEAAKRRYYVKNKKVIRAKNKIWRNENAVFIRVLNAKRRALRRQAAVPLTTEEQATVVALYAKARAMTELSGEPYHVDHIKPLAKGGLHHPSNLQVLRGVDNLKKGAKYGGSE